LLAQRHLEEAGPQAVEIQNKKIMPDVRGMSMRKVLEVMKGYEVPVVLVGTGKAVSQRPLPGSLLSQRTPCQVQFHPVL